MSTVATPSITRSTCYLHPQREAAAKCVSCGRSFCRECVTPVDRRMMCAACFKEKTAVKEVKARDWFVLAIAGQAVLGLLGVWFVSYFIGRVLLEIPTDFHEGTVWEKIMP
jgi:hypothetical protein